MRLTISKAFFLCLCLCSYAYALSPSTPWVKPTTVTDIAANCKVAGKIFYMDKVDGDDTKSCNSAANACKSWKGINPKRVSGACILLKNGSDFRATTQSQVDNDSSYNPRLDNIPNGTASAYTVYGNYGNPSDPLPIIGYKYPGLKKGSAPDVGINKNGETIPGRSYIVFEHINFHGFRRLHFSTERDAGPPLVEKASHDIIIRNNIIEYPDWNGIKVDACGNDKHPSSTTAGRPHHFLIAHNKFQHTGAAKSLSDPNAASGEAIYFSSDKEGGTGGDCAKYVGAADFIIEENEITDFSKEPIDIKHNIVGTNYVRGNYIHDSDVYDDMGGVSLGRNENTDNKGYFYNNYIFNVSLIEDKHGDALSIGQGWKAYNNVIANNPRLYCLSVRKGSNYAYYNTCYGNTDGFLNPQCAGISACGAPTTANVKNNIRESNGSLAKTDNLVGTASMFVDPSHNNFALKSTATAAIDQATALPSGVAVPTTDIVGATRPTGNGPDYGAFEFGGAPPPPPPEPVGSEHFVATNGSDTLNTGESISSPWKTIGKCISAGFTNPGSICTVRGGPYAENIVISGKVGTDIEDGAYTLRAYAGDPAVVVSPASGANVLTITGGARFNIVDGLHFDGSHTTGAVVLFGPNEWYNELRNVEVYGGPSYGIHIAKGSPFNAVKNSYLHDNGAVPNPAAIHMVSGKNIIWDNRILNNRGRGIDLYDPDATSDVSFQFTDIQRNTVGNNLGWGMYFADMGDDSKIWNNVVFNSGAGGILVNDGSNTDPAQRTLIYNNTITGNTGSCINIGSKANDNVITNNICWKNQADIQDSGTATVKTTNSPNATDPLFVDESIYNFNLRADSSARDTGTKLPDITVDVEGTARPQPTNGLVDKGAYEAPPVVNVKVGVRAFTTPTAAPLVQDITLGAVGTQTPKAVRILLSGGVTSGTPQTGARLSVGAADSASQWWLANQATEGGIPNDADNVQKSGACMAFIKGDRTTLFYATCTLIPGGVRLTYNVPPDAGYKGAAVFFWGTDLNAKVGTLTLAGTSTPVAVATSFKPDLVFLDAGRHQDFSGAGVPDFIGKWGIHTSAPLSDYGLSFNGDAQLAYSSESWAIVSATGLQTLEFGGLREKLNVTYPGSTGFTVTNTVSGATSQMGYMALSLAGVKVKTEILTTPSAANAGNTDYTAAGFSPQFVMAYMSTRPSLDSINSLDSSQAGLAVSDGQTDYSASWQVQDAVPSGTVPSKSLSTTSFALPTDTGSGKLLEAFPVFLTNGTRLNYATNPASAYKWVFLSIENTSPRPPSAPANLIVTTGEGPGVLNATWDAALGATSYHLACGTVPGGAKPFTLESAQLFDTLGGLANATRYYCTVNADNGILSPASGEASAVTLTVPDPPAGFSCTASTTSCDATCTWTSAAGTQYYTIYRRLAPTDPWDEAGESSDPSFTNEFLEADTDYSYSATATLNNIESALSAPSTVHTPLTCSAPVTPPPAPGNLTAQAGTGAISLVWEASAGADGYRVYRSTVSTAGYAALADTPGLTYSDTAITQGLAYYYVVVPLAGTLEGAQSCMAQATAVVPAPAAPTGFTVQTGPCPAQAVLDWNDTAGAQSYRVYRAPVAAGPFALIASPVSSAYADNALTPNLTYFWQVSAFNGVEGPRTAPTAGTASMSCPPDPPIAPSPVTATPGTCPLRIDLDWPDVVTANTYHVTRSTTSGSGYAPLSDPGASLYSDASVLPDTTYYFKVSADNGVTGPASTEVSAKTAAVGCPLGAPGKPSGFSAIARTCPLRVDLAWAPVTTATSYKVYRGPAEGPFTVVGQPTGTTYSDTTLSVSQSYIYFVTAFNGTEGGPSLSQPATTPDEACPIVLMAPENLNAHFETCPLKNVVAWDPVPDATGYQLFRSGSEAGPFTALEQLTGTTYDDGGVTTLQLYAYRVAALHGTTVGTLTAPVSVSTPASECPPIPPATPVWVSAVQGTCPYQVELDWEDAALATRYRVERSTMSDGIYEGVATPFTSDYKDSNLALGQTYYYRILSDNGLMSLPSEVRSVTTAGARCPPPSPGSLEATVLTCPLRISLNWPDVETATSYHVRRAPTVGGPYTQIAAPTTSLYNDNSVVVASTYHFQVTADNGTESPFVYATATTPAEACSISGGGSGGDTEERRRRRN